LLQTSNQDKPQDKQSDVHGIKSRLNREKIDLILNQIKSLDSAKLIGLMCHFVYWSVFGNFNSLYLDNYHQKSLLTTLLK